MREIRRKMHFFADKFAYFPEKLYLCYVKGNGQQRKEADMQAAVANQYERLTVHVPLAEVKRFRAVMKALGFEIEKKNAIDRAFDDIEAGRIKHYESLDDLKKAIG